MCHLSDAELERKGIEAGFRGVFLESWKEGFRQGFQEGRHIQAQESLLIILRFRFVRVPAKVQVHLKQLTIEQLEEAIAPALQAESITTFVQSLPQLSTVK
jgi:hypothetical protein